MSKLNDFPVYSLKTKKRVKRGIVASGILVILLMAYLLQPDLTPVYGSNKISTEVTISVERDGKLINNVTKEDDLILLNFADFLYYLQLHAGFPEPPSAWAARDLEYSVASIVMWNITSSYTIADSNVESPRNGAWFMIGSNGTAPTRGDWVLTELEFADWCFASSFQTHADGFSISGQGVVADEDPVDDILEVGMGVVYMDFEGSTPAILMLRDVVSAIEIEQYDLITVSYRFIFGAGYTQNFMDLLLDLLYGVDAGEGSSIWMTDTAGDPYSINIFEYNPSAEWFGYIPDAEHNYGLWVALGTGSTAFDKDQYGLQGGGTMLVGAYTYAPEDGSEFVFYGMFIPTSAMTAYEAGFYRATETSDGLHYFMLGRLTFAAKPIGAGITAKVEFTEEF